MPQKPPPRRTPPSVPQSATQSAPPPSVSQPGNVGGSVVASHNVTGAQNGAANDSAASLER